MAITTVTALAANVAAFDSVIYEGTTDRWPFNLAGVRYSMSIDGITEDTGFISVELTSNESWLVNDTVLISGCTGDYTIFNGRHNIESKSGEDFITLATAWIAPASTEGTFGRLFRMNDNLFIRAKVYNDEDEEIAQLYAKVTKGGAFRFDFSKSLQIELSSIFSLTAGELSTDGASHHYTIDLTEIFQGADYSNVYTDSIDLETIAHRTTVYNSDYVSGVKLLNGNLFAWDKIVFHFMYTTKDNVRIKMVTDRVGEAGRTTYFALTAINNYHLGWVIAWPNGSDDYPLPAKYVTLTVQHDSGTGYEDVKNTIVINRVRECDTVLYYLNRLGGYECYKFHDSEDTQETIKIEQYTAETWRERVLFGEAYGNDTRKQIRDIVTSPETYDIDGIKVEVLTKNMTYRAREVEPELTVRYDENYINS